LLFLPYGCRLVNRRYEKIANWDIVTWILVIGGGAIIGIILFFALRELFCWYWKINRMMEVLEEIRDRLPKIEPEVLPENSQSASQ